MIDILQSAQNFWEKLILNLLRDQVSEAVVRFFQSPLFLGFCILVLAGGFGYIIFSRTIAGIQWHHRRSELRRNLSPHGRFEEAGRLSRGGRGTV
mgnify:CR=1 FL=1